MNNSELRKLLELLGEASNEISPIFSKGGEVEDFWSLEALPELYRFIEGLAK